LIITAQGCASFTTLELIIMNANQAKKLVAESMKAHGIEYTKLTAKTVSFEDLARGSKVFVSPYGLTVVPDARLQLVEADLKGTGAILDI